MSLAVSIFQKWGSSHCSLSAVITYLKVLAGAVLYQIIKVPKEVIASAVSDAQEFLKITPSEFNNLANKWEGLSEELWQTKSPVEFYKSWFGVYGKANICANIKDQFSRGYVYYELKRFRKKRRTFLDYGCGTGVMSFTFIKDFERSYLLDVDNLAKDFLKFRCRKHRLTPTIINEDEYDLIPDNSIDICLCIDVLEHVRNPSFLFSVIDSKLREGSILLFSAPFGSGCYAHLKEAKLDWHQKRGAKLLSNNYNRIGIVSYKKKK